MTTSLSPTRPEVRRVRTPQVRTLGRLLTIAAAANQPDAPGVEELAERSRDEAITRRDYLKASGILLAARPSRRRRPGRPGPRPTTAHTGRIAVVGAGIAGLNATFVLKKAGYRARLYCADDRIGGRIVSTHNVMTSGLTVELGGEFIDSDQHEILGLAAEFGLGLLDTFADHLQTTYVFDGVRYTDSQIISALRPLAARVRSDVNSLSSFYSAARHNASDVTLDQISVQEYLDLAGADRVIHQLIRSAYLGEDGLELGQQSSLNLITGLGTNLRRGVDLFGTSNERYKIRGGNEQIVERLAGQVGDQIELGKRLVAIQAQGHGFVLTFETSTGPTEPVFADIVILALPYSILRNVEMDVDLPPIKRLAIDQLAYGKNTKIVFGVNARSWRDRGYRGDAYTSEEFQESWDATLIERGTAGAMALLVGGNEGIVAGRGTAVASYHRYVPGLERVFPGISSQFNGKVERAYWPGQPYVHASYATYGPGQYTSIGGAQFFPVGNLHFAGEHCNHPDLGYMDGAAKTGRMAAQNVIAQLRR